MNRLESGTMEESPDTNQEKYGDHDFDEGELKKINDMLNLSGDSFNLEALNKYIKGEDRVRVRELIDEYSQLVDGPTLRKDRKKIVDEIIAISDHIK